MNTKLVYVFKLSKIEFSGGITELTEWLIRKRNTDGQYHFRKHTPRNIKVGSIVLFEIEGKIIGQGVVKEGLQPVPEEDKPALGFSYPYFITFEPSSLEIFRQSPSESDVSRAIGKRFGRLFKELSWIDYLIILSMTENKKAFAEEKFKEVSKELTKEEILSLIADRNKLNGIYKETSVSQTKRHYRDPYLALYLKKLYKDECQIKGCTSDNQVQQGYFTDTHHMVPPNKVLAELWDVSTNLLVLCPNHHRQFHRSTVKLIEKRKNVILLKVADKNVEAELIEPE